MARDFVISSTDRLNEMVYKVFGCVRDGAKKKEEPFFVFIKPIFIYPKFIITQCRIVHGQSIQIFEAVCNGPIFISKYFRTNNAISGSVRGRLTTLVVEAATVPPFEICSAQRKVKLRSDRCLYVDCTIYGLILFVSSNHSNKLVCFVWCFGGRGLNTT